MDVRTPGTAGASDPDDVDINVDVDREQVPAVTETTPERRQERRERIGNALERVDVDVDSDGTDVKID